MLPSLSASVFRLWLVMLLLGGFSSMAFAACPASNSPPPTGSQAPDIVINPGDNCNLHAGSYYYRNVNIVGNPSAAPAVYGTLNFLDEAINFYAENIVGENGGVMTAGTAKAPIGTNGGSLTIHLYGAQADAGAACSSANCGVPGDIWSSNPNPNTASCTTKTLPGNVTECFYPYMALNNPDSNGLNANVPAKLFPGETAASYFGHKVLALSYGGRLQLFGSKGALVPDAATHPQDVTCEATASCTGRSWGRLQGSLVPGATSLQVEGQFDWQAGDHIVVTTTDYLPGHSEELQIVGTPVYNPPSSPGGVGTTTVQFQLVNPPSPSQTGVVWPHNGMTYPIPQNSVIKANLDRDFVETRAAVGLLTRSIQIVSDGNTPGAPFTEAPGNYLGGHLIARQGFEAFQAQGVEFRQLGQGGAMGHYAVHFHLARTTPPDTFVRDCSVNESMTRWVTIHGTHGVNLERNIGYKSIGHGFYLEDGTEIKNTLNANLGVFARAAIDNTQNPRKIPGILAGQLASPGYPLPYDHQNFAQQSDFESPSVFWIMNGWNDFQYNMAAGAGACGACYWLLPAVNSGPSASLKWFGYASQQQSSGNAGTTPLKNFVGNFCSTAMHSFQVTGQNGSCVGLAFPGNPPANTAPPLNNPYLPVLSNNYAPLQSSDASSQYYPNAPAETTRLATRCQGADTPPGTLDTVDCSTQAPCGGASSAGSTGIAKPACDAVVVDHYTSSFNFAPPAISTIWFRPQWSLFSNSALTDVLGGGLSFITGGGYDESSVIPGYWGLARKSVFIGDTQYSQVRNLVKGNPLASNAGPFNPLPWAPLDKLPNIKGLYCAPDNSPAYCASQDEGVTFMNGGFLSIQRLFNIYDGPAYQDSNVYLSIHPTPLTGPNNEPTGCNPKGGVYNLNDTRPCLPSAGQSGWGSAMQLLGPRKVQENGKWLCYLPNAAIGWKQPNGFYYAPAFHSQKLYFGDDTNAEADYRAQYAVGIRHYVTEPLFLPGTLSDDPSAIGAMYCNYQDNMFGSSFTGIDRQTVLNDDDGSLTGLRAYDPALKRTDPTLSINLDSFYVEPDSVTECASDRPPLDDTKNSTLPAPPPATNTGTGTANTSPLQYVSTVIYPDCASTNTCNESVWSNPCNLPACYGVPLYRQLLANGEVADETQQIRMMGQLAWQRSSLTANHGIYYVDTTKSANTQSAKTYVNVFQPGGKYYMFFVFAKETIKQTYQFYVGKNLSFDPTANVSAVRALFPTINYQFIPLNNWPVDWVRRYDAASGILEVKVDMGSTDLNTPISYFSLSRTNIPNPPPPFPPGKPISLGQTLCQPSSLCSWDDTNQQCSPVVKAGAGGTDSRFTGPGWTDGDLQQICNWSVKESPCPAGGCLGFSITMPSGFAPDDQNHRVWSYTDAAGTHAYPQPFPPTAFPTSSSPWLQSVLYRPLGQSSSDQCYYADKHAIPVSSSGSSSVKLSASISGKAGIQTARAWTVMVSNAGTRTAQNVQINGLTLKQTFGAKCSPVITSPAPFPLGIGDAKAQSAVSGNVTINFTGCAATARFSADIAYGSDSGAALGVNTFTNQYR